MHVECATIAVGGIPGRHRWGERDRYVAGCESPDIAGEWSPSAASRGNQRWRGSHRPTGCAIFLSYHRWAGAAPDRSSGRGRQC